MKRRSVFQCALVLMFVLATGTLELIAAESPSQVLAARPYYTMFATSIDRLLAVCETIFDSVDRPDLSASLGDRLKGFRDFAGIDRTKPFGTMWTWGEISQAEIVFLPVKEIDELLRTCTYNNSVGHHMVRPNQYEIERPRTPYHVLVRNDYALLADSPLTIQALRITPEQLTRGLRDRYDAVIHLDLKQLPRQAKTRFVEHLRTLTEPWLQEKDNEAVEIANLRRIVGKVALDLIERVILDTNTVTVGGQLDPESHLLSFEVVFDAAKESQLEAGINRLVFGRSKFTSLVSPDVPAGLAINLPLGGLIEQILGPPDAKVAIGSRLEAGLQLVGSGFGQLSLIAVLRGSEVTLLNNAIPQLIINFDKSDFFSSVSESFDTHDGVAFHSMSPREMPAAINTLVGSEVEIIIGQGKQIVWIGIGQPDTLLDRLKEAIDLIDEPSENSGAGSLLHARIQARQLPEIVPSDLLIPAIEPEASRAAFDKGGDGFSLMVEPVAGGLKLRIEAEEGFIRLIGRDWIKQIDELKR